MRATSHDTVIFTKGQLFISSCIIIELMRLKNANHAENKIKSFFLLNIEKVC